jgi:hypothetical protein
MKQDPVAMEVIAEDKQRHQGLQAQESVKSIDSADSDHFPEDYKILDTKIKAMREELGNDYMWNRLISAFKILSVDRDFTSKRLAFFFITEDSMRDNFEKLFGYPCDILARIIYIKMASRKRCARIDFLQFAEAMMDIVDEVKDRRNRAIFNLIEFNGDGELDIMILMQLFNNIPRESMFGQEILKMVREYKNKNVLMKGGFTR